MFRNELPMATLSGVHSTSVAIQFWKDRDNEYANFIAAISSPLSEPSIEQSVETCSYCLNNADILNQLLDGDSTACFSLNAIRFSLKIFEQTWGVRYGFIAETTISTITEYDRAPWPNEIGAYLLDGNSQAGCLRFAFVCEYDALRSFAQQLAQMYSSAFP